jgi:autotransporter adhesin
LANEGIGSTASGFASHAEGLNTTASGTASHAEGFQTIASGDTAHAEGNTTTAGGSASHSEGHLTQATIDTAHAEGNSTTASGDASHAEGYLTIASGISSHAEGGMAAASGLYAHAEGIETIASGNASHAEGNSTTASGDTSHAEGQGTTANADQSHAEGLNTTVAVGATAAHAEGEGTTASGLRSHAEGLNTTASGVDSHAEGAGTTASGFRSHAEGVSTTASGGDSHAEGAGTTASGFVAHAEGAGTTASGDFSHAEGIITTADGTFSHASGSGTSTGGFEGAFIIGSNGIASAPNSFFVANGAVPFDPAGRVISLFNNGDGCFEGTVTAAAFVTAAVACDFAEMFESLDGQSIDVGYFVTFDNDGDKIRKATSADDYILGITSSNPAVLANTEDPGCSKFVFDEWNRVQYEDVVIAAVTDPKGNVIIPERIERRPKINPYWDPNQNCKSRRERPEWVAVGLIGQLLVREDGTCKAGRYCMPNDEGIATAAVKGYRVIKRTGPNQILILVK